MNIYIKTALIIIAIAYLISPVDLIPDLYIPFFGWIDDAFLIGMVIYYLQFGRLPHFFQRQGRTRRATEEDRRKAGSYEDTSTNRNHTDNDHFGDQWQDSHGPSGTAIIKEPHEILDVDRNATKEEIQAAYRKAVKEYHPDRVAHLGKELQSFANTKFIEIEKARKDMMNLRRFH